MKIELGLKTGIALPLLAILIIGMSILVVFNYLSQINILQKEEAQSIESSINTAQFFIETAGIHYQQMAALVANMPDIQETLSKKIGIV